jgi:hypothetical protein
MEVGFLRSLGRFGVVLYLHTRFPAHVSLVTFVLVTDSRTFCVYSPSPRIRPDLGDNSCRVSHSPRRRSALYERDSSSMLWMHVFSRDGYCRKDRHLRPFVSQSRCRSSLENCDIRFIRESAISQVKAVEVEEKGKRTNGEVESVFFRF